MAIRLAVFHFFLFLSTIFFIPVARAQESSVPVVIPQTVDQELFKNLEAKYFFLLEQYRNQEQTYSIAKNQYLQLNTLASQELAVQETRTLIDMRADILLTYIDILTQLLSNTRGVPIENKNAQIISLSLLRERVLLHKTKNLNSLDRLTLDAESASFQTTYKQIEQNAYYTLSLIRIGEMQEAYDKMVVVRNAVESSIQNSELSSAKKGEKERGFQEIDRTILSTQQDFNVTKQKVLTKPGDSSLSSFSELSRSLAVTYSQISQVVEFLQEVRK